jgi:hypothetical protein
MGEPHVTESELRAQIGSASRRWLIAMVARAQGYTDVAIKTGSFQVYGLAPGETMVTFVPSYDALDDAIRLFDGEYHVSFNRVIRQKRLLYAVHMSAPSKTRPATIESWVMEGETKTEALLRLWLLVEWLPTQTFDEA